MGTKGSTRKRSESAPDFSLNAVVYKEGDWWVAQCVDHDIATQARTVDQLYGEYERLIVGHIVASLAAGTRPFADTPAPPPHFRSMFASAKVVVMRPEPEFVLPPELAAQYFQPPQLK
jgi:hypothetical protein